jgi:hypothetical protein
MQFRRVAFCAGLALAASTAAAAAHADTEKYQGPEAYRTAVFWSPADRLWAGAVTPGACSVAGKRAAAIAHTPVAAYEQRGELIGEIRSSPAKAPEVLAQAKSCAVEADSATTTRALVTAADANWGTFRTAFSACMTRNHEAEYVGSMTLWIDQRCNW